MTKRGALIVGSLTVIAVASAAAVFAVRGGAAKPKPAATLDRAHQRRQLLFKDIQPVTLSNCTLERFGEQNDGGYLLCANLLGGVRSAYSYGISGYDQWGCDVSTRLKVPVHEYDCFNLTKPVCDTGRAIFHGECIGNSTRVEEGRPFDTLEQQVARNGDAGVPLVVKMDVEGAEWDSFIDMPEAVLERIDQMAVELHGIDDDRALLAIWKLKKIFHIVNLHWNNFACDSGADPFPASVYEILFVNKRIGVLDPATPARQSPLNRPNNPGWRDCQTWVAQ